MKLLIAEDDVLIREGLRDILEGEGYTCVLADNGQVALEQYHKHRPALMLLDIMMPEKDGYAVCKAVRQTDEQTAIIFISAKSEEIDRVLGLELGADDYIMKPFGKHEVVARIRAVTRRYLASGGIVHNENRKSPTGVNSTGVNSSDVDSSDVDSVDAGDTASAPFSMGDLLVNPKELRASRGDERIELSLRDCAMLSLLYRHANQVVTRDQLFNACWGRDYLPSSRTLDQHVSKLRKAIERDPSSPQIIKTVHGVGYRYQSL